MVSIGELSLQTGLRPSALRYYEEIGLLPAPERRHGRRVYGDQALDRIAFIQFARACGFRLDEIAVLVGARGNSQARLSTRWRPLAANKVKEMDDLIAKAEAMKRFLGVALTCECVAADECGRLVRTSRSARSS